MSGTSPHWKRRYAIDLILGLTDGDARPLAQAEVEAWPDDTLFGWLQERGYAWNAAYQLWVQATTATDERGWRRT